MLNIHCFKGIPNSWHVYCLYYNGYVVYKFRAPNFCEDKIMNIKKFAVNGCLGAALALLFAGGAQASTYCSAPGVHPDGLDVNQMTFNSNNADDCFGVVIGNEPKTNGSLTDGFNDLNLTWGTDWTFLAKDDDPGDPLNGVGSFGGFQFTLAADAGTTGSWTLTGVDLNGDGTPPDFPVFFDFVGMLKASDRYALWFFDDAKVEANNNGTFTINFVNNGGNFPDLSHMNLYIREGDDPGQQIPEPGTLALLGLGLAGLSALRRRKK